MIAMALVMAMGAFSAWLYARTRRWPDAALVLAAALALAGLLGDFKIAAPSAHNVSIDPDAAVIDIGNATSITIAGNGMGAAQWRDLPARPLRWDAPAGGLELDFPRSVPPGGTFTLRARWGARRDLRLQLLSEHGRLLAESASTQATATQAVHWTPPAVEDIVLQARVLDAKGTLLAQGPIPVRVEVAAPLRVQGRFASASFDKRALRTLLESSHALLDWKVTLGPGVTRSHLPRAPIGRPDLIVTDAAWMERHGVEERSALLAHVKGGASMLVLGEDARNQAVWSALLALELVEQAPGVLARPLAMTRAALRPLAQGPWTVDGALATRSFGNGRIGWLSVADWHRHAITNPRMLADWWQDVLDRLAVQRTQSFVWAEPEPMALAGQRLELCAYGATGTVSLPQLGQTLTWQRRPERADAACVAVWPTAPGWLQVHGAGQATRIYVHSPHDWPGWQAALEREATRRYAARTPSAAVARAVPLPAWPFAGVFVLAMLGLWWRERRTSAGPGQHA